MNKEQVKNFLKSKKAKKLLLIICIAAVGIAAIVGVSIWMDSSRLHLVNAHPSVSDRCSDAIVEEIFLENTAFAVSSCDCNVVNSIRKTGETSAHDDALLLEGYSAKFASLGKAYSDFLQEFNQFNQTLTIGVTDRAYEYYKEFYDLAEDVFLSTSAASDLGINAETSLDDSIVLGLNADFFFTFREDAGLSAETLRTKIANLFSYKEFTSFRKTAQYKLMDAFRAYLNSTEAAISFNELAIDGAVITADDAMILPYVFKNEAGTTVLCYVIWEESTETLSLWANDAPALLSLIAEKAPDADVDEIVSSIVTYGRCSLFEQPKTVELSAGSVSGGGLHSSGASVTVKAVANPGFTFTGWTNADGSIASSEAEYHLEMPRSALNLTANWDVTTQNLILHISQDETLTSSFNVLTSTFFIDPPTRDGYAFQGWERDNPDPIGRTFLPRIPADDFVSTGTTTDVELYAVWKESYTITYLFSEADQAAGAYNASENPQHCIVGDTLVLRDPVKNAGATGGKYVFDGWYLGDTRVENGTISEVTSDLTLTAKWKDEVSYYNIIKEGDTTYVEFGAYPQHILEDQRTVLRIKSEIAKGNIVPDDETGIFEYNNTPYMRVVASPYQKGVVFSDGTDVVDGEEYFFVIEPIRWRVLDVDETSGEWLLLSEYALDAQLFREKMSVRSMDGKPVYANNWAQSDIRAWLQEVFFEDAFKSGEQNLIAETENDFGAETAYFSKFANGTTVKDTVFLLSYADMGNAAYGWNKKTSGEDALKRAVATDYAKAIGIYSSLAESKDTIDERDAAHWWLRSSGDFEDKAEIVTAPGSLATYKTNCEAIGVRPVIKLKTK